MGKNYIFCWIMDVLLWTLNQIFCDKRASPGVGKMFCARATFLPMKLQFAWRVGEKGILDATDQSGWVSWSFTAILCKPTPSCLLSNCFCHYFPVKRKGKEKVMWPLVFWNNMITMHIFKGTGRLKNSWGWWWEQPPPNIQDWWRNQKNLQSLWEAVEKTRSGQSNLIVPFHYIWDWPLLVACGYGMGWAEALQRRQNPRTHAKHGKWGERVKRKAKRRLHWVLMVLPLGPCLTRH